jgi:dihydroxy-acid dehydratase
MLSSKAILRRAANVRSIHVSAAPAAAAKEGLNRHSRMVTQSKSQGASQVSLFGCNVISRPRLSIIWPTHQAMLYATEGIEKDEDFDKAMVGVASVW